jgi:hypothetical protein
MKIPSPVTNLRAARDFALKWEWRVGETWNAGTVPPHVREHGRRLVAWAERRCR